MIVSQVIQLMCREIPKMVQLARIAFSVLGHQQEKHPYGCQSAQPDESETDPESDSVRRHLAWKEDVACDEAATVTDADLRGSCDAFLIVTTDIIAQPDHDDGLGDIAATRDEIECQVSSAHWDMLHVEKNSIAYGRDAAADNDGCEAVS